MGNPDGLVLLKERGLENHPGGKKGLLCWQVSLGWLFAACMSSGRDSGNDRDNRDSALFNPERCGTFSFYCKSAGLRNCCS